MKHWIVKWKLVMEPGLYQITLTDFPPVATRSNRRKIRLLSQGSIRWPIDRALPSQVTPTYYYTAHIRPQRSSQLEEGIQGIPARMSNTDWLVSTRKADLSIRTSRTNRLMYSRVVVDPCIFITRSLSYMTLPVHRKVPVAVDSYESYGSSNVFTSRCRPVNIITDSLNAHGRMSIPRSTKNNAWIAHRRMSILVLLRTTREMRTGEWIFLVLQRTMREMCRCQNSHFTEWIHGSTTTHEFIRRPVRLVRVVNP